MLAQSCTTLFNVMDCSPPGSSVHRILQAKLLEWVAISSCGAPPDPEIELASLVLPGRFFSPAVPGDQHKASKSSEKSSQRTMSLVTENLTLSSPLSVFMWASHPAASTVLAQPHGAILDEDK